MSEDLYDRDFPNLKRLGYRLTSQPHYHNCIAYAAGDFVRKWWPGEYPPRSGDFWPPGIPWDNESLDVFIQAFATLGYSPCPNGEWEPGYEKVAFYVWRGEVQHAARQQSDGTWRSKLGGDEDIEHTLQGLEGPAYGTVAGFVRRPIPGYDPLASKGWRAWFRGLFRRTIRRREG